MIYKGNATCKKHGQFEWIIVEGEENFKIGKNLITTNIKTYDKNLNFILANCPKGCGVEISYKFDKN